MNYLLKLKQSINASNPLRYFKSAGWLVLAKLLGMVVSLITTIYITRTLGPQNFGELSYAQSVVGILGFLGALASGSIIYRDLIKQPYPSKIILGTAWVVSFLTSILTLAIVFIFSLAVPHDLLTKQVLYILAFAQFFNAFNIIRSVFLAQAETKALSLLQLGHHIIISLAKVIAMISGHGVLVLAAIMFVEQFLTALYLSLLYTHHHKHSLKEWSFKYPYAKQLLKDSLPFIIITSSALISGRIDQVMIKHSLDTATVGLYQAAVQLSEVWQILPGLVLSALFPAIVNAKKHNEDTYHKRLKIFAGAITFYGILAFLFTFIFAPFIINFIYGAEFLGSVPIIRVYTWSAIGTVLGYLVSYWLVSENWRTIQMLTGVIPMLINVILNFIWIPIYGAIGAAAATAISYTILPFVPLVLMKIKFLKR